MVAMKPLLLVVAVMPLVACVAGDRAANNGVCPAGEVCSTKTPKGLSFIGANLSDATLTALGGPLPTLIGGTQEVRLELADSSPVAPLTLPFVADPGTGGAFTIASSATSSVTIRGAAAASSYLRILDPADRALYDRKLLAGATLDHVSLVSIHEELPSGQALAVTPSGGDVAIALWGGYPVNLVGRVADTSMRLTLPPGATQVAWDAVHLTNPALGHQVITVAAGDHAAVEVAFDVVAPGAVDRIVVQQPLGPVKVHDGAYACFSALAGDRAVIGLPWTITVDGTVATGSPPNCAIIPTDHVGTVTVVASAAGKQLTLAVQVVAAAARTLPTVTVDEPVRSIYGERAAMR
jgi:hypothetical protein